MTCIWWTAERCTLIVVWEILATARWVTYSIRLDSNDGNEKILDAVQKCMYFFFPVEYFAIVDGASPWARKSSAFLWRSAKCGVSREGTGYYKTRQCRR